MPNVLFFFFLRRFYFVHLLEPGPPALLAPPDFPGETEEMGGTAHRAIAAEEHQPPLSLQSSPRAPDLVLFYLKDLQLEGEYILIFVLFSVKCTQNLTRAQVYRRKAVIKLGKQFFSWVWIVFLVFICSSSRRLGLVELKDHVALLLTSLVRI